MKSTPSTFYYKVPKAINDLANAFRRFCEDNPGDIVMKEYFSAYWPEFKSFWQQGGEVIDWITFALAPHNAQWFTTWVFVKYPEVYERVLADMKKSAGKYLEGK